jgi:hypothetical protein
VRLNKPRSTHFIDLTGQIFGRLTVLSRAERSGKDTRWLCLCECGNKRTTVGSRLKRGTCQSCGCLRNENVRAARLTHGHTVGHTQSTEYRTWIAVLHRTSHPNQVGYPNYGGRGISICPEWKDSFTRFLADMGLKPTPQHTIERVDVDGNYTPANCKWATRIEQAANKRTSVLIEGLGSRKVLAEWARVFEVSPTKLKKNINECGDIFFAALVLKPSLLGMLCWAERQAQLDSEDRERREREEAEVLQVIEV